MTTASPIRVILSDDFDPALVQRVVAAATERDGVEPLNEAALLELRHRGLGDGTLWLAGDDAEPDGFAWVHGGEVDLVVAPSARGRGVGAALAQAVTTTTPGGRDADAAPGDGQARSRPVEPLSAWSHGNHPAAARLADRFGWDRVRDLWVMRRPLTDLPPLDDAAQRAGAAHVAVRPFRPGGDEEAFLELNAAAFAGHPEQGRMTRADLDQRMAEPWFDAAGFFVAERAGGQVGGAEAGGESGGGHGGAAAGGGTAGADERPTGGAPEGGPGRAGGLLGFHWTKVHDTEPPHGEVYVVGVSPEAQGIGLGRLLTLSGLHHLAGLGLAEVVLYVESDNAAAIATYSGLGFTHADSDTHVMYRAPAR